MKEVNIKKIKNVGDSVHLIIALFTIFSTWRYGDWANWKKYHTTMMYIATGGLLYEYLTHDNSLWTFHPDFLFNEQLTVIVYALVTMPLSVLIFLSRYPRTLRKQLFYLIKWVIIYASVELLLQSYGRISFHHGWSFYHSLLFDMMMFPMLIFHHWKPLRAYLVTIVIIIFLMQWLNVPMH
ncbi:MAG: CBO0543 family protein [Bacillota bacterium]